MTNDIRTNVKEQLNVLKGKKIIIIGHNNIDIDSALSGLLMSKLLTFLNIENKFCILDEVEQNTVDTIKELVGIDISGYKQKCEDKQKNLFLLDHYETTYEGEVIGCIDHHPNKQRKNYKFMYVRNSCATAYLIYEIMKQVEFPIGRQEAKMVIVSMMADTISFRSTKTVKEEMEQAKNIATEYKLDYKKIERDCLLLTPIDKLTVEEIISNGKKTYNYNGKKVISSYVQLYGLPKQQDVKTWLKALESKIQNPQIDMIVFIICETKSNTTYEYQIMKDCIKKIVNKGELLSRGQKVMPLIEERFIQDNKHKMKEIVKRLAKQRKTLATMESCTGGQLASEITNIDGASEILKESYVSYSNEAKIKFGLPAKIIDKHTVYSEQTASGMAKAVRKTAKSQIGIGITGQIGRVDPNNSGCDVNNVWYSINEGDKELICKLIITKECERSEKKQIIVREIIESLYNLY